MNRRTFEGPMDWEYQNNRGPVDVSSPFSQIPQRSFGGSSFNTESPSKPASRAANPFASIGTSTGSAFAAPPSPSKQQFPRPPSSSIFHPPTTKSYPAASPFRNPAFTTPQKRADEIFSECSGAEESPAVQSDVSMAAEDTPDYERYDHEFAHATITPASAVSRKLFHNQDDSLVDSPASPQQSSQQRQASPSRPTSSHTSGRGAVPRGKFDHLFGRRDRVRKRKRQLGDKDVGSVRSRHHNSSYTSDEEDDSDASEWTDGDRAQRRRGGDNKKGRRGARAGQGEDGALTKKGAIGNFFSAIHDHPNVPLILSWWVQLGMNVFFMAVVMWFVWGGISMMRADISHAADAARSRLLAQMNDCAHEYTKNRCAPISERLPALNVMCNEWEVCMNQDPASVMKLQVSAKNVAEIINEFVGVMSFKAWGFILSAMLAVILASNMGFSRFRDAAFDPAKPNLPSQHSYTSQPIGGPPGPSSLPSSQDPNQAYIWAPIGQTPRHIRREFMLQPDTPTDTDGSPDVPRAAIMPPPQTPSFRRSPSKGEREHNRSPTKAGRSPSKVY
ncbi:hypothetical protein SBRCBS47491_003660 [Sporothrix bragantina]|uniref:Brl1/Brr6 domain-containing protein n=1 Tax=Sporothrix bragantina TaxID=671064 RepID=A0ABP0BI19_9PEZI